MRQTLNSFHGFNLQHKIGAGGMSTVFMGNHATLGYPVAIKVLHPSMSGDQGFISRFEREAKAASSLNHNNIVNVIDFGSENDIYFIVMQFIDGDDLGKIISDIAPGRNVAQFPLEITMLLLEEIAHGLKAAHQQGIVHRDIKPSNVMISASGDVKLTDFGLARDMSDIGVSSSLDLTIPGTVVGTPAYMSPEQAAGGKIDETTDIFSLGVMAYHLILGKKPFGGATALEIQEHIINTEFPPINDQTCPRHTSEIEHLLTKMLAKTPARRFQNMDQVLRALLAAQESIDPSGGILKYKREYLSRFAESPVAFTNELREMAISGYLKRGFYYKSMGDSSISDAAHEFRSVLSIDPEHTKAKSELWELKKKAQESGVSLVAKKLAPQPETDRHDPFATQELPPGIDFLEKVPSGYHRSGVHSKPPENEVTAVFETPSVEENLQPPVDETSVSPPPDVVVHDRPTFKPPAKEPVALTSSKRPLIFSGLALVVVAIVVVFVVQPWSGKETLETSPVVVVNDEVESAENTVLQAEPIDIPDENLNAEVEARLVRTAELAQREMTAAKASLSIEEFQAYPELKDRFAQAETNEREATGMMSAGQAEEAKRGFVEAGRAYSQLSDDLRVAKRNGEVAIAEPIDLSPDQVEPSEELVSTLNNEREKMDQAKSRALRKGCNVNAAGEFNRALEKETSAITLLEEGNESGFEDAALLFTEAKDLFDGACVIADLKLAKADASTARNLMYHDKDDLGRFTGALRNKCTEFLAADKHENDGDKSFKDGRYSQAKTSFTLAKSQYEAAFPALLTLEHASEMANIQTIFDEFYLSINNKDFVTFASFIDMNEDSKNYKGFKGILDKLTSVSDKNTTVSMDDDNKRATVKIQLTLNYKTKTNSSSELSMPMDWSWEMSLVDEKWSKKFIQ